MKALKAIYDPDNWREIVATLARNKTRTLMTAFGIFWGTAMLAMLLGGAGGLKDTMMANFDGFAANSGFAFTQRTSKAYAGFNKGRSWDMTTDDVDQIRRLCPEIDGLTTMNGYGCTASYGKRYYNAQLTGVDADYTKVMLPRIVEGRFINSTDDAQVRKVAVIGRTVADNLFPGESPLGKFVAVNGIYYKVVGVVYQTSEININGKLDESVVIPNSTLRQGYHLGHQVDAILFVTKPGTRPSQVEGRIRRVLCNNHQLHPDDKQALTVFDVSEQFEMLDNLFLGITMLALFVGVGSLMAGVIGVGNIMWVIVKERTPEIGIRRAIGAKPGDIIAQILSESVLLTLVAGVAGICFAAIVLGIAQMALDSPDSHPHYQLLFSQAVGILVTFIILGTAAGTVPAIKAMKIKPIEAMRE
ncbi:MAG: ABC transporter permease [Bacteroidales bacterium]|nr:ABC transporter permease [Bacteroidales bacterium]